MTEIKYHVLRALLTSGQRHSNAKLLYDQFDGGSENRNYTNFAFYSALVKSGCLQEVQGARLVAGHTHGAVDAMITAPRAAYEKVETICLGDCIEAMLSATKHSNKRPTVVFINEVSLIVVQLHVSKAELTLLF